MKLAWTSLAVAIFSIVAMGQQIKLDGRLISDEGKPVPNVRVTIAEEQSAPTDKNGKFSIRLTSRLKEGERVVIILDNTVFLINQPLDGDWIIPPAGTKGLEVIVTARGSRAAH